MSRVDAQKQSFVHETVLLEEAVEALIVDSSGRYVDATFGRGGHSRKVLSGLSEKGSLLAFDKDPVAIKAGKALEQEDSRFGIVHDSFAEIKKYAQEPLQGVLADLGVSSPQLDDAERGFSFLNEGPLDMRMDTERGDSAADWLSNAEESEIAKVLKEYGEERFAKRIARAIVDERSVRDLTSTLQLAKVVSEANPAWEKNKHPATRAFQAIRIKVNNELGDLEAFLEDSVNCLAVGGRLVVISFHSLEDRMVKRFMRHKAKGNTPPPGVPVLEKDIARPFKVSSKAIKPSKDEVEKNVRSRSAVMRVLERISDD